MPSEEIALNVELNSWLLFNKPQPKWEPSQLSYRDYRLGAQLQGLTNCPHCGVSSPLIFRLWASDTVIGRTDGLPPSRWSVFSCTTCGHLIVAMGTPGDSTGAPEVEQIFPDVWEVDGTVPDRVKSYLSQAHQTLRSPDASVVMSASSVDAMLKDKGLDQGSLYQRIDLAVEQGLLTQTMAEWAHRVRLDANNPRHADNTAPHMSAEDARRAFDYANALVEYLYVLPSKMPPPTP